jgi:hypothetical protein
MNAAYAEKRKSGPPRKPTANSDSLERVRRFQDRKHLELKTAEIMASVVAERVRAIAPKNMPPEFIDAASDAAEQSSRLISEAGPGLVANLIKMAEGGDMQAYQMLAKNIMPTQLTRVKLPADQSLNELTTSVMDEVSSGRMSVEVGEKVLGLVSKAADVAVSGSLVARLNKLNEQLQQAREHKQLPSSVDKLSQRIVSIDAIPK